MAITVAPTQQTGIPPTVKETQSTDFVTLNDKEGCLWNRLMTNTPVSPLSKDNNKTFCVGGSSLHTYTAADEACKTQL